MERASRSEQSGIDAWQAEQLDQDPAGQVTGKVWSSSL